MKRALWTTVVWLFLAPVCLVAADFKPTIPATGYKHDRWITKSDGHVNTFRAYRSSFDTEDDDDGDGQPDFLGVPEWVAYQLNVGSPTEPQSKPSRWLPVLDLPTADKAACSCERDFSRRTYALTAPRSTPGNRAISRLECPERCSVSIE